MTTDNLIKLSNYFHINDISIGHYCHKALSFDSKYSLFNHKVLEFIDNYKFYYNSYDLFSTYLIFHYLKKSLNDDVNINSFEKSFFKRINIFLSKNFKGKELENKSLQSAYKWATLLKIYAQLLELISTLKPIKIFYNFEIFLPIKTISNNIQKDSYFLTVPLVLLFENSIQVVNIIPTEDNTPLNFHNLSILKYFGKSLNCLHSFSISLSSHKYSYKQFYKNEIDIKKSLQIYDKLVLSDSPNIFNCQSCPAASICSTNSKFISTFPLKYKKS